VTTSTITVLAFARAREVLGFAEKIVPMEPSQTADGLLKNLCPDWRERLPDCRIALDLEFVDQSTPLRAGQTLAIIPPVSGG
jgi:molybdopterin synthase sulfur carrier subunit